MGGRGSPLSRQSAASGTGPEGEASKSARGKKKKQKQENRKPRPPPPPRTPPQLPRGTPARFQTRAAPSIPRRSAVARRQRSAHHGRDAGHGDLRGSRVPLRRVRRAERGAGPGEQRSGRGPAPPPEPLHHRAFAAAEHGASLCSHLRVGLAPGPRSVAASLRGAENVGGALPPRRGGSEAARVWRRLPRRWRAQR